MKNVIALSVLLMSSHALSMGAINSFSANTAISSGMVNSNFIMTKAAVDTLEATVAASNIGMYSFPAVPPTTGQVLTWNGAALQWQAQSGGGTGITSLNGDTSMVHTFAVGNTGATPSFSSVGGGVHTLNLPMASSGGTTAGLISFSEYQTFANKLSAPPGTYGQVLTFTATGWQAENGVNLGGNSAPAPFSVGTMGSYSTSLKTNGIDRLSIDQSGYVNIGGSPTNGAKLSVDAGTVGIISGSIMQGMGTLNTSSGNQTGLFINPTIQQTGSASYTGLKVLVSESQIGSGPNRLLDLQKDSQSMFAVDRNGFVAGPGDWMGSMTAGSPNIMCINGEPTIAQRYQVMNVNTDFGTFSTNITTAGVYEILIDTPMVPSGVDFQINNVLFDGTNMIHLQPGRNIKRLPVGNYSFYLGCISASSVNATITGNMSVLGIRKLH